MLDNFLAQRDNFIPNESGKTNNLWIFPDYFVFLFGIHYQLLNWLTSRFKVPKWKLIQSRGKKCIQKRIAVDSVRRDWRENGRKALEKKKRNELSQWQWAERRKKAISFLGISFSNHSFYQLSIAKCINQQQWKSISNSSRAPHTRFSIRFHNSVCCECVCAWACFFCLWLAKCLASLLIWLSSLHYYYFFVASKIRSRFEFLCRQLILCVVARNVLLILVQNIHFRSAHQQISLLWKKYFDGSATRFR